ncbi:type II toxin-antitoxin system HicA family toxin [Thermosynechococcaceae cyanobacterium BACA0444]|uniref:Type II toxin-antitoxin system HicA family toxin n=1 Tax=Pseudocalidococcus azoricus BACA0444 TaxID=2918990 RepID=A0AAE4FSC5_9CYAN|nr:type II toxin-antitoxin system HicA family toxin [Pseudocalidococcus azoricus]MDS3860888.1 type II toxin-antitoxin system HicA family toxin [Pseudocalidococcus azoricus BACA0444]
MHILERFGFEVYSQRGSHIKLRRMNQTHKETLTIPNHRELDTGTCRAIFRQACRYVSETELFPYFYQ